MMGGAAAASAPQPEAPHETAPAAPAPTPAPAMAPSVAAAAPKAEGTVRIGVVKIKDASGQSLPVDNLRINLMSEITRRHMDALPLDADAPQSAVEAEARTKQCDYILFTVPTQVSEPSGGPLPIASLPKGVTLDPAKYQALTLMTLYKVGKPLPEIKDLHLAADGAQFGVNAVMATFEQESEKIAQQVQEDAHPKAAAKPAAKKPASRPKPR